MKRKIVISIIVFGIVLILFAVRLSNSNKEQNRYNIGFCNQTGESLENVELKWHPEKRNMPWGHFPKGDSNIAWIMLFVNMDVPQKILVSIKDYSGEHKYELNTELPRRFTGDILIIARKTLNGIYVGFKTSDLNCLSRGIGVPKLNEDEKFLKPFLGSQTAKDTENKK